MALPSPLSLNSGGWVTLQGPGQEKHRQTPKRTLRSEMPPCPLPSSAPQRPQHKRGAGRNGERGARESASGPGQTRAPAVGSALSGAHLTPSGGPAPGAGVATAATTEAGSATTAPSPAHPLPSPGCSASGRKRSPAQRWPWSRTTWAEGRPALRLPRAALPPDPGPEPGQQHSVPGKTARGSWAPTAQLTTMRCGQAAADLLVCLEPSYPHIHTYSHLSPSVSRALR